ncbi:MAG: glycosyltransferase family 39 protein [Bacteroidia bacterium]|nr:glycosyltransferase family 39 protein [Bacteroidia bacterium]
MFQISDGGTSGYTVGECPLLYYFVAILWKIFGYSDFIYRFVNAIIFFIGLFALYKLVCKITTDHFWSMVIPLLLFTSPVIAYYTPNYLTDTTSLALVFIGWNVLYSYFNEHKKNAFYFAIFIFTIAGLIKISSLISVVALILLMIFNTLKQKKENSQQSTQFSFDKIIPFSLMFATIFAWYLFAVFYNKKHNAVASDGSPYFSTQAFPIWNLSKTDIYEILGEIKSNWIFEYQNAVVLLLFIFSIIICFYVLLKHKSFLLQLSAIITIGVFVFCSLWFYAFSQHDYYIINLLILPLFSIVAFVEYAIHNKNKWVQSNFTKSLVAVLIIFSVYYSKEKLQDRYNGPKNEYHSYKDFHTITPYLRKIGIKPTDKVISLPHYAPCYTLYLMNQPGWAATNFEYEILQIRKYIRLGARYLIINGEDIAKKSCFTMYTKNQIGQYGSVSIYKL